MKLRTFEGDRLVYRGRVGSGFGEREFDEVVPLLDSRTRRTSPFAEVPPDVRDAQWVTPDLVAEVKFTELTADGHIRHGTWQALRRDKPALTVGLDRAVEDNMKADGNAPSGAGKVKGVKITNPDRKVFDNPAVTKLQVAEHYAAMAERMLPIIRNRPVSLLGCPDGTTGQCFFQKHRGDGMPAAVGTVAISEEVGDADYITLSSAAGPVGCTQMGAIEFHIWGSRNASLEQPDRIVFDLDPDEGLPFSAVRSAASHLRDCLVDLGLPCTAMLSGGKGIHVIVPLRPKAEWEAVKLFSRTVAVMLSDAQPDRFIATMSKAKRKGLIFIDWLRNERGSTAIAPYSLRARPGAKVAVPVTWEELRTIESAGAFDIATVLGRLDVPCPLQQATRSAAALDGAVLKRLEKHLAG